MARHLSYANVIATLALFIALGGGAYAAIKLPKNSVTTTQVKNGSLLAKDFRKGQLKAGPRGAQGERGPAGQTGAAGAAGAQGEPGVKGDQGIAGSAKAYGYITPQGGVAQSGKGIAKVTAFPFSQYCIDVDFPISSAVVNPDVLSGGSNVVAEVQAPSLNTGPCGDQQIYVRIAEESFDQNTKTITRTGYAGGHGFYIEIN
jgi:hypothetical protein